MLKKMLAVLSVSLLMAGTAVAGTKGSQEITAPEAKSAEKHEELDFNLPQQLPPDHWALKELAALQEKYQVDKKLPEGKPCTKSELLDCFLATLADIVTRYNQVGSEAVTRDDLDTIRNLVVALQSDLFKIDGYREMRRTIEELLVQVEPTGIPYYKYQAGVSGFLRGEGQSNFSIPDAAYRSGHNEGRFLYRVKPFLYWHPNQYLDVHLEGQGYGYAASNQDHNRFSLYQGFIEAKLPREDVPGKSWVGLKAGRQEFNYGSSFILGSDTFFNGLTFDAVRLRMQPAVPWLNFLTVDLLAGRYAKPSSDGIGGNLTGAYLTYEPAEDNTVEVYGFRDTGAEERHAGAHLDTVGFRSTSGVGMLKLEYEAAYQTGRQFNEATGFNDTVDAFGGHVDLTGEFKLGNYDNSIFMSFAYGSGDKNAANGIDSRREFRNPNNDNSLVGDMGVIGDLSGLDVGDHHASGLRIYTLGWGVDIPVGTTIGRKLNFSATGRKFVAGSVEDGFSRDLGVETDFTLTYAINKDYSVIVGYDRFFTGKFFRDASGSGRDIDYGYAMFVFNYDWTKRIPLKK